MSHRRHIPTPIVRFLGEEAGQGGPFALLGLPHSIQSDEHIRRAQLQRLRQIDSHPHRGTPDAEEVRLAIYSAARQLLDPALREQLAIRWPEGSPVDLPKAWRRSPKLHHLTPGLLRRARLVLGSSGGWNPVARRRLAHLARINRISAIEVIRALGSPVEKRQGEAAKRPQPMPELPPEPGGGGSWVFAYALLGLLACVVLITIVLDPLDGRSGRAPDVIPEQKLADSSTLLSPHGAANLPERNHLSHYTAIAHELDRLVLRARSEPRDAMARFNEVYPQFVARWTEFPPEAIKRASANIAEFITRLEQGSIPPEEIAPLMAIAGLDPDRVMISSSIIDVVLASPSLSTDTRASLREVRSRLSDATITPRNEVLPRAQEVALTLALESSSDDPAWWGAWLRGTLHATAASPQDRTRLLLQAMTTRLMDQSSSTEQWEKTAILMVKALDWRADSPERFWLLEQFGDRRVPTPRLAMLTRALVSQSSAEGVDQRFVLSANANDPQRATLAQDYERAWFPKRTTAQNSGDTPPGDELLRQLSVAMVSTSATLDDAQAVERILALTTLNASASLRLDGKHALSEELLQNPPELPTARPEPIEIRRTAEDDEWAVKARNCDEAGQLRPYLDQLLIENRVGINSAHALVYLSYRSPDPELRDLATAQLVRYADQLPVLLAIDHVLNDSGSASSRLDRMLNSVLGYELPNRNAKEWYTQARRELLVRMSRAIGAAEQPRVNALQAELSRLLQLQLEDDTRETNLTSQPGDLLQRLNQHDRVAIEPDLASSGTMRSQVEAGDARSVVRFARAESGMQRYLAAQLHAISIRSIRLRARYPDTDIRIDEMLDELDIRLSQSNSVLQQITQCERALAFLSYTRLLREGTP